MELAEYFGRQGTLVRIYAPLTGGPVRDQLVEFPNVSIVENLADFDVDRIELLWVHHQIVPDKIIDRTVGGDWCTPTVFHHMSPTTDLEQPFLIDIEKAIGTLVLYNSRETRDAIERAFDIDPRRGMVFGNPAPDAFAALERVPGDGAVMAGAGGGRRVLRRLLVVTNHLQPEVEESLRILTKWGVEVHQMGSWEGGERRVAPHHIAWADAILSIGKTVQYALVAGVPVYCYDHFGGPGYLSAENIRLAADLNFSGRGFSKKSASQIAGELARSFADAASFAAEHRESALNDYSLSRKMATVLGRLNAADLPSTRLARPAGEAAKRVQALLWPAFVESRELRTLLAEIESSRSWRVTAPLRRLLSAVAKI